MAKKRSKKLKKQVEELTRRLDYLEEVHGMSTITHTVIEEDPAELIYNDDKEYDSYV